jgi:AmmeMemoRadiSam system protein A
MTARSDLSEALTPEERARLLKLARQALEEGVRNLPPSPLDLRELSPRLREDGAAFVTLTIGGELRGCIGALEAYQPLAEDVREHAVAAALQDWRFPPVQPEELPKIEIEISRLTSPQPLHYDHPEDLLTLLRPGVDGIVLRDGMRRATFLPQVWEKIPDPRLFLSQLCLKMGASPDLWRRKKLEVFTYQVEEFHE